MVENIDKELFSFAKKIFPITRSITGDGVRKTLTLISEHIPLTCHEVPTGTQVFDWTVPKEWNIRDAYIKDPNGKKIVDFKKNNLHVLGYSTPVKAKLSLKKLKDHLYSLEKKPTVIPYLTSYYKERWGFCLTHEQREKLPEGSYEVLIDSSLQDGSLTYGELVIPGEREEEVFLSTYVCHPSMANNEVSGPVVTTWLAKWLLSAPRKYTYRIVFVPETIGSLAYLSRHLAVLRKNVVAGFNITCVGDDRAYSYLPSRQEDTLADRVALNILGSEHPNFTRYSWLDRGSDERQYCSPGVNLPVASVMRSSYNGYPEYHTSADTLGGVVTPKGLQGGYTVLRQCIELLEHNTLYQSTIQGEPWLAKRNMNPDLYRSDRSYRKILHTLSYCDGTRDLIAISDKTGIPARELYEIIDVLLSADLIVETTPKPSIAVGTDIENIARFQQLSVEFKQKVYTPLERAYCEGKQKPAQHFAARFAAKEAVMKALKQFGEDAEYQEIEILNNDDGAPLVNDKKNGCAIMISLSHDPEKAIACCVVKRK